MMEAQVCTSQAIRRLLVKARQISGNKEEAGGGDANNDWKVDQLKVEIHRLFGVMDWMLETSPGYVTPKIRKEILAAKRELKSEATNLKELPIRRRDQVPSAQQLASFSYSNLNPECREDFLRKLTSPQDKLSILKEFPEVGPLMGWNPTNLYFELVYPIIVENGNLSKKDVFDLCRVSPSFRDAICKDFERGLTKPDIDWRSGKRIYGMAANDLDYTAEKSFHLIRANEILHKLGPDWCHSTPLLLNAFPIIPIDQCDLQFPLNLAPTYLPDLLSAAEYWYLCFRCTSTCRSHMLSFLNESLLATPNLIRLAVESERGCCTPMWDACKNLALFDLKLLPDLPHLKYLELDGDAETVEYLLERYLKDLEGLSIVTNSFNCRPSLKTDTIPVAAPRLTTLTFSHWCDYGFNYFTKKLLAKIDASPLRAINFYGRSSEVEVNLPKLMTALNAFGGTLEELKLVGLVGSEKDHDHTHTQKPTEAPPTWIQELSFPKIRSYCQENFGGCWAVVLRFPRLEELILQDVDQKENNSFFGEKCMLELSWDREEMYSANVWKLLPALERITLKWKLGSNRLEITRTQCIRFQRAALKNSAELSKALSEL